MALIECKECKEQVSDKAKSCPHCGAQVKGHKVIKQKKWHERTSVTLCVAAILIILAFGFIHVITGVVSPFGLPFDIALKKSFGYSETFVNAKKITAIPYTAAKIKYPISCEVLQRKEYVESGKVFETRIKHELQGNMKKWQAEFKKALNKPEQHWQDQLKGETKALEREPSDAEVYNNRGIASAKSGQYETAISDFTRAIKRIPGLAEAYYNRGLVYVALGQLNQGVSDFTKALEIKPRFTEACTKRGHLYFAMDQYDQAISDFTKVLEIDPMCAEVCFSRCIVYYAKGEYDKAWEDVHGLLCAYRISQESA